MGSILSGAVSMGIVAWIWANASSFMGVQAWAGFMGTTTYYGVGSALGERFVKGWLRGMFVNMVGVLWAIFCVEASKVLPIPNIVAIMTGVISFGIVAEAKWKHLMYVPGVYIGCSTTFGMLALGQSYLSTAAVLLMGSVVGLVSDAGGAWLDKITSKNKKVESEDNAQQA